MKAGQLNRRVEFWRNAKSKNGLGENDISPVLLKTVWASIVPQTGNMTRAQAETILTSVTTKIVTRYNSASHITTADYIRYAGKRYDIRFILDPYEKHETLEFFCEAKG